MDGNRAENDEKKGNTKAAAAEKPSSRTNGTGAPGSFDVDQLIALRHDRKGRVEFLVRWKTYDASHDTWVRRNAGPAALSAAATSLHLSAISLPPAA